MKNYLIAAVSAMLLLQSCEKDSPIENNKNKITQPNNQNKNVYSFLKNERTSTDFYQMRVLLDMYTHTERYAKDGLSLELKEQELRNLFQNKNTPFKPLNSELFNSFEVLNKETSLSLSNFFASSTYGKLHLEKINKRFEKNIKDLLRTSKQREQAAEQGKAGYLIYGKNNRRLVDEGAIETVQILTKMFMGAFQLDRIINHLMLPETLNVSNEKLVEGKNYTAMEHLWDEAFALTGLPEDSKINYVENASASDKSKYARFWSGYIYRVDVSAAGKGVKAQLYDAFISGRQAIAEKNYTKRDENAHKIGELLSKVCAVRSAYYLKNGVKYLKAATGNSSAEASHEISEGLGFAYALFFSSKKLDYSKDIEDIITDKGLWEKEKAIAKIESLLTKITQEFQIAKSDL